jgi:hypothetical protein
MERFLSLHIDSPKQITKPENCLIFQFSPSSLYMLFLCVLMVSEALHPSYIVVNYRVEATARDLYDLDIKVPQAESAR